MIDRPSILHPEFRHSRHERGPFELEGLPHGSMRRWFVYDSLGVIRLEVAMHDRDVDEGFEDRLSAKLDELEERDKQREA